MKTINFGNKGVLGAVAIGLLAALSAGCSGNASDAAAKDPSTGDGKTDEAQQAWITGRGWDVAGCGGASVFDIFNNSNFANNNSDASNFIAVDRSDLANLNMQLSAVDSFGNETAINQTATQASSFLQSLLDASTNNINAAQQSSMAASQSAAQNTSLAVNDTAATATNSVVTDSAATMTQDTSAAHTDHHRDISTASNSNQASAANRSSAANQASAANRSSADNIASEAASNNAFNNANAFNSFFTPFFGGGFGFGARSLGGGAGSNVSAFNNALANNNFLSALNASDVSNFSNVANASNAANASNVANASNTAVMNAFDNATTDATHVAAATTAHESTVAASTRAAHSRTRVANTEAQQASQQAAATAANQNSTAQHTAATQNQSQQASTMAFQNLSNVNSQHMILKVDTQAFANRTNSLFRVFQGNNNAVTSQASFNLATPGCF